MRVKSQFDRRREVGQLAKAIMRMSDEHRRTAIPSLVRWLEDALREDAESETQSAFLESHDEGSIIGRDMPGF
jgi:hypothetical protein